MTKVNYVRANFTVNRDGTVDAELTDKNGITTTKRFGTEAEAAEVGFRAECVNWMRFGYPIMTEAQK